jgi:CBS domain-containing protein
VTRHARTLSIHDAMTLRPITVTPGTTIGELMEAFDRHDYNAFPVVDDAGGLRGIVTKLDVLRALRPVRDLELPDLRAVAARRVEDIMRPGVIAVEPEDPVVVAADLMVETRLRSLPVVQRSHGRPPVLVGIVSQGDLLRGLRFEMADEQIAAGLQSVPQEGKR